LKTNSFPKSRINAVFFTNTALMKGKLSKNALKKTAFTVVSVLIFFASFTLSGGTVKTAVAQENMNGSPTENMRTVNANETVEHLFTHCLISHPEIAFRQGNEYGKHLDRDCLTPKEFERILAELFKNGYALVDVRETFETVNGEVRRKNFAFPKDKKPLVLSFDDVVYTEKNRGKGMSDKLVLTENGEIMACTETGSNQRLHDREFLPILEDFIEKHPDFSPFGARGIIFLTGFDGILGYRTQRDSKNRAEEIKQVKPLLAKMQANGWIFGCHSYAHGHMRKMTAEQMQSDVKKWQSEVESLVGKTQIYAYPYGEWILGEDCNDERQKALINAGFSLFCGVGEATFYSKMPLKSTQNKILFQDRCPLDGVTLRKNRLNRFFQSEKIYDSARPIPFL